MQKLASGKIDTDIASCGTLSASLRQARDRYGDQPALLSKDDNGQYNCATTLSEFVSQAETIAGNLKDLGLESEGRLALWASNCASWNLTDVAASFSRCATVGIYVNDCAEDVLYKINDSDSRFLFTDDADRLKKILPIVKDQAPGLKKIFFFGNSPFDDDIVLPFDLLLHETGTSIQDRVEATQSSDMAKLLYTSGTTGRPKGAIVTHGSLLSNAVSFTENVIVNEKDVLISYMPNAHIFQALLDYTAWLNGACLGYSNKLTLKADLPTLRPNFVPGVPKVFIMMLMGMEQALSSMTDGKESLFSGEFENATFASKLKGLVGLDRAGYCLSGAAKLEPDIIRRYRDKLDLVINEGYGISEVSGAVSIGNPWAGKIGYCGKPIPGLEIEARNQDGATLPPGEQGELCIRGPMLFSGYLNNAEATAEALRDGWYHTGDLGQVDDEGYVQVLGRTGNRVKFANGEYYDLEAIGDAFLRRCRLIGQVVASGEQRERCVGIVCLSEDLLVAQTLAKQLNIEFNDPRELIYNNEIVAKVFEEFNKIHNETRQYNPYERIDKAIYIRPFSAANGEATPTNKTRIRNVIDKYAGEIENMYSSEDTFTVLYLDD